jgi:hypothetical protein
VTGMRRAVAVLILAFVASGCGGPSPVPHRTWVTTVCQALSPWRDRLTALNTQTARQMAGATTPAQARDQLLGLLDGARRASDDARAKIAGAGVPDVKDGAAIAERFVTALTAVRDAYGKAHDSVKALPDKDFYPGVTSAMQALNTAYAKAGIDTAKVASADLRKDFDEVPACG